MKLLNTQRVFELVYKNLLVQKNIKYLLPVAVLAACSRVFPLISKAYYILPLLMLYFIYVSIKEIKVNQTLRITVLLLLLFSFWCMLTSFWSSYPLITLGRSLYFALISVGSVTGGYLYIKTKNSFDLNFLLPLNILIIFLSLTSLFLNIPYDAWSGGNGKGFMGFASHQNTLGALILFTMPASVWGIIKEVKDKVKVGLTFNSQPEADEPLKQELKTCLPKGKIKNAKFVLYLLLLIFNFSFLILTYSRASILSLFLAGVIYLLLLFGWKFVFYSAILLTAIFCLLTAFLSLRNEAWNFLKKGYNDPYVTRRILWEPSYKAALRGGSIGLGYGISDPKIILEGTGSHYENGRYVREKGNSVLAIIEETGVIGLILFMLPISYMAIKLFKVVRKHEGMGEWMHGKRWKWKDGVMKKLRKRMGKNWNNEQTIQAHNTTMPFRKSKLTGTSHECSSLRFQVSSLHLLSIPFIIALLLHAQFEAWWVGVGSVLLPLFYLLLSANVKNI